MRSSFIATLNLTQAGIILTSVVCMSALCTSFYYNYCNKEEMSIQARMLEEDYKNLRTKHSSLESEHSRCRQKIEDLRKCCSNDILSIQKKCDEKIESLVKKQELELKDLKDMLEQSKIWARNLSNDAIVVIQRQKQEIDYLKNLNKGLHSTPTSYTRTPSKPNTPKQKQYSSCNFCYGSGKIPGPPVRRNINGHFYMKPGNLMKCPKCNGSGKTL